jgi:DNA-binding beta-propeller fold protein YncE
MVLADEGKWLVATVPGAGMVAFLSVHRMEAGKGNPVLGMIWDGDRAGSIYANVSGDGRLLFVSDERLHQVSVIDLDKARRTNFAQSSRIGSIPVGLAPVGLAFSRDGRYLFITSEVWGRIAQRASGERYVAPMPADETQANPWPMTCHPEVGRKTRKDKLIRWPEGAISVVSVARAAKDPGHSVIENVPAGCIPVRVVVAPDGRTIYVTARESNSLLAFDAEKLLADSKYALLASVPVGTSPVGLALVDRGRKAIVANSSRFGGSAGRDLVVVDTAEIRAGKATVVGMLPAGKFPRELHTTRDGQALILTNYGSQEVELIDLDRLRLLLKPVKNPGPEKAAPRTPAP